jgi:Protein of unknown function (DUF3073)
MGRGRAKAKQTKVARQLKYNSGGIDLERLRDELVHDDNGRDGQTEASHRSRDGANTTAVDEDDDPYADPYDEYDDPYAAAYADDDEDDDARR